MFPFPQPQFAAINHRYSALIKAIHHIDFLPLPSKAKITQSSSDGHSLALEDYSIQHCARDKQGPSHRAERTQNMDVSPVDNNRRNGLD